MEEEELDEEGKGEKEWRVEEEEDDEEEVGGEDALFE